MKVQLKQIRSAIGITQRQKDNLRSLKLGRIGNVSVFDDKDSAFLGRLNAIKHLVSIEKL